MQSEILLLRLQELLQTNRDLVAPIRVSLKDGRTAVSEPVSISALEEQLDDRLANITFVACRREDGRTDITEEMSNDLFIFQAILRAELFLSSERVRVLAKDASEDNPLSLEICI